MSPSEIYGSGETGETEPEHQRSADRLGQVYESIEPPEKTPDGRFVIRFGNADDPIEAYERIIASSPPSTVTERSELPPEVRKANLERIRREEYELALPPERVLEEVRQEIWVPRGAGEIARPTHLVLFDADGRRPEVPVSGIDERSDLVKEWIIENHSMWDARFTQINSHAEAKLVVDMVRGELPDHLVGVVDNVPCNNVDEERASCISFARESLHPYQTLRLYDMDGRMHQIENNQYIPPETGKEGA